MGQVVSVDVAHKLGAEEAQRRVRAGLDMLQQKYADKLKSVAINWSESRADFALGVMGQELKGALEFLPDCVRVSLDLPWILAMFAEKAKGMLGQHTSEMLQLPAPKG